MLYDLPSDCMHYHAIDCVTFLLNATQIQMIPVSWILNSVLLPVMLLHKLAMINWEIKAEKIPRPTDFAN